MPKSRGGHELTPRDREILKDIIRSFILSGEPVSSRAVAKNQHHGLSAASIRNIMADLEDWGYLSQPHTSAGRVPTRAGYHHYIESLMQRRAVPDEEKRYIEQNLQGSAGEAEQLMNVASHLLSELSEQAGIVLTPVLGETVLRRIDFVPLSGSLILCVVISVSGIIVNKVIETESAFPREDLLKISDYLTDHFAGKTLRQIRDLLLRSMADERAQVDRLMSQALILAKQGLTDDEGQQLVVDGTSILLNKPELASLDRVRRLLDTFAEKARLVRILNSCMQGTGVQVLIGEDTDLTSELDFSLVATTYGVGERPLGSLGIFGPSRMEYPRVIPLVQFLGEALSHALASSVGRN